MGVRLIGRSSTNPECHPGTLELYPSMESRFSAKPAAWHQYERQTGFDALAPPEFSMPLASYGIPRPLSFIFLGVAFLVRYEYSYKYEYVYSTRTVRSCHDTAVQYGPGGRAAVSRCNGKIFVAGRCAQVQGHTLSVLSALSRRLLLRLLLLRR